MEKLKQLFRRYELLWGSPPSPRIKVPKFPILISIENQGSASGSNYDAIDYLNLFIRSVREVDDLVFNSKVLRLNKKQCENLSSKLMTAVHNIQELVNFVSSPQSGADLSTAFTPALENFCRILEKAKALVKNCCNGEDWCEASAFQFQNEEAFKDILLDVGLGYNVIFDQAKGISEERNFRTLQDNLHPHPVAFSLVDVEEVCKDQQMLQQALEDQVAGKRTPSSINPRKQHLARYLLGKLKSIRQQGQLMEDLDMSGEILWVTDVEPAGTWGNLEILGSGSGAICVGKSTWLGIPCAIKVFTAGVSEVTFVKETRILVHLNHPNIIKFLCCGNDPRKGHYFIAMELMEMSLSEVIKLRAKDRGPLFSPIVALDIIVQIARGMCYLHDVGIAHRDLKPSNVVINKLSNIPHLVDTCCVKLIDFGMSRTKVEVSKSNTISVPNTGTTRYRAPEVFRNAHFAEGDGGRVAWSKADVYSFGITCAEILSLEEAFEGIPLTRLYNELEKGTRPPLPARAYPEKLVALVQECCHGHPHSRPSFLEICKRLEEVRYDLLMGIPSTTDQGTLQQFIIYSSTSNDYIKMMFKNCSESRRQLIKHVVKDMDSEEDPEVAMSSGYSITVARQIMDLLKEPSILIQTSARVWQPKTARNSPNWYPHFETEHTWEFVVAPDNNDLFCINKVGTQSFTTEFHILNADANYQQFRWQSGINLGETGQNFQFAVAQNRDLFAIKKYLTDTGSTEVRILTASSDYQEYRLQTGTALHETDHTSQFLLASNDDLYCIKKSNTGSKTTEVHVLSASSNYQSFVLQTGTNLPETDLSWDFIGVGWNNDVYAIRRSNASSDTPRLYVLNRASHYQTLSVHQIQCLPKIDHKFAFTLGQNSDLFVIQKSGTVPGKTHLQVLTASSQYQDSPSRYITTLPETDSTCEYFCTTDEGNVTGHGGDLIVVNRNDNWIGWKTAVYVFRETSGIELLRYRFHIELDETNHTFDFALAKNDDLFAIKKSNTGTEINILDASSGYENLKLHAEVIPLPETDHTWKFLVGETRNLIAIKKSDTRSQRTEVCVLTAVSKYQSFRVQVGCRTILEETDDAWDFAMAPNDDLIAIHKYGTESHHTEINVLSSESNYQEFKLQSQITELPETDYTTAFTVTPDLHLLAIRKSNFPFSRNLA